VNQANFDGMNDGELRRYFLANRQDQAAFDTYLERVRQRPKSIMAHPSDPDFDEKLQAALRQKLAAAQAEATGNSDSCGHT
jgi:hypothetical protein